MLSLSHRMFLQMASWFCSSIWLAVSRTQSALWDTLEKLLLHCVFRTHAAHFWGLRANLHISVFHTRTTRPKSGFGNFWYKSFGYSREKSERPCLLFSRMTKSRTWRDYPYFRNALLIFIIFRNEYSRAVTVSMYAKKHLVNTRYTKSPPGTL